MADQCLLCYSAALNYLRYRPRSESEMRQRLTGRGFDGVSVNAALVRLKGEGLLDDRQFAEFWRDNRQSFRPRSRRLTKMELMRKGVSPEVIEGVIGNIDDAENAYRIAQSKLHGLSGLDYAAFRYKLGNYLRRRGFSYETIEQTVKQIWQEASSNRC